MRRALLFSSIVLLSCGPGVREIATNAPQKPAATVAAPVAPPADKSAYPNAPRQNAPWTAPQTALGEAFTSAATKLFDQGLADPRDLPYREIEIVVGEPWFGGGKPLKTHGWVFAKDQFAVAWNGLVYAIQSAGPAADLRADVQKLLDDEDAARKKNEKENPGWDYHRFPSTAESYFVGTSSPTIIKAMLLLRLGETSLAERVASILHGARDAKVDPYLEGAEDWLWSAYDRGLTAHMRGEAGLALESVRRLPELSKEVDAECAARKIERGYGSKPNAPYISFLDGIDDVVLEMRRRASAKRAPPLDASGIAALASLPQNERITRLIDALDDVSARQMGQPGGVALGEDPIVQALIKEGEPAVDPLIATFENDTRLTRSVQFWRDFARYRSVLAVYEAAYVALSGILDASFFQAVSTGDHLTARGVEGRREVGKKIREFWAKWKGVTIEERSYRVLDDDAAGADQWLVAAQKITQPSNVQIIPSSNVFQSSWTTSLPPGQKPTLLGEALRAKTSPSVSSLFAKRLGALTNGRVACAFASAFAAWDARAALPHLASLVKSEIATYASSSEKSAVGSCIADLTTARADGGDAGALADYGAWLAKTNPKDAEWNLAGWFAPMIAHPAAAPVVAAANAIFAPPSPWIPFVSDSSGYDLERILELDLFKLDAFKRHIASKLLDKKVIGTITVRSKDNVEIKTASFTSSRGTGMPNDPLVAPDGTVMNLRVCDEYASVLAGSQVSHAPPYNVAWREPHRDAALAQMSAWIKTR